MTVEEMLNSAENALKHQTRMTMAVPRPWKNRPPKFPRGELLCIHEKSSIYSFPPKKVIAWLNANMPKVSL